MVEFYPCFKFYCLLFLDIVMYVNDFETKEHIIYTKGKIQPQDTAKSKKVALVTGHW